MSINLADIRGRTEDLETESIFSELEAIKAGVGDFKEPNKEQVKAIENNIFNSRVSIINIRNYLPVPLIVSYFDGHTGARSFTQAAASEDFLTVGSESSSLNLTAFQLNKSSRICDLVVDFDRQGVELRKNLSEFYKSNSAADPFRLAGVKEATLIQKNGETIQMLKNGSVRVSLRKSISILNKVFAIIEIGSTLNPVVLKVEHFTALRTEAMQTAVGLDGLQTALKQLEALESPNGLVIVINNLLREDLVPGGHFPKINDAGSSVLKSRIRAMSTKHMVLKGTSEGVVTFLVNRTDYGIAIAYGAQWFANYFGLGFIRADAKPGPELLSAFFNNYNSSNLDDWKRSMASNMDVEIGVRNVIVRGRMSKGPKSILQVFIAAV